MADTADDGGFVLALENMERDYEGNTKRRKQSKKVRFAHILAFLCPGEPTKKNNKYSTKLFEIGVEDGLGGRFRWVICVGGGWWIFRFSRSRFLLLYRWRW